MTAAIGLAEGSTATAPEADRTITEPSTSESPDPLVGEMVDHYRIEARLGAGGMGVVYRALDTRLERIVALKFLPAHLRADPAANQRVLVEARAAAALDHPNICTVHEVRDAANGPSFIAMAFYPGETLGCMLARGAFDWQRAVDLAAQIARGLAAAHERGIVHRDVKPANIAVTPDGVVKILDFGIARAPSAFPSGRAPAPGTVAYMAPEQAAGGAVGHRADLWSVGVILYEMCTGMRPFRARTREELLLAIERERPLLPSRSRPDVPAALDAVVDRLLQSDPRSRHGNAQQLVRELDRIAWSAPGAEQRPRIRWVQGRARLMAALAIAALAAWFVARGFSPDPVRTSVETRSERAPVHASSTDRETYDIYLWGRYFWSSRTPQALTRALGNFERAAGRDPSFAPAFAGIAGAHGFLAAASEETPSESMNKARAAALHALDLDDSDSQAHAVRAYTATWNEWDWPTAARHFRRALELDPENDTAHHWYSIYLAATGRTREGVTAMWRAQELEPSSLMLRTALAVRLYLAREYELSAEQFENVFEFERPSVPAHYWLAFCYIALDRAPDAVAFLEAARPESRDSHQAALAIAYHAAGRGADARRLLEDLERRAGQMHVPPSALARAYSAVGDKDAALLWLERAAEERDGWLTFVKVEPLFDSLRGEPRFQRVLARMGLAE